MGKVGVLGAVVLTAVATTATSACVTGTPRSRGGQLQVVAAENFWGSIAAQLGGTRVSVTELIDSPSADPHDYEPTPADGRDVATADYVVVNGLGYDAWATDLVEADGTAGQTVLDVGALLGLSVGDNPHRWYFPADVHRVVDRIAADYERLDPVHAPYYAARHDHFTKVTLRPYDDLIAAVRARYSGTPIGASENIVAGLADATGLDLVTPSSFLDAVTEGRDPAPSDKVVADEQLRTGAVAVFVANSQNATPDVQQLVDEAHAHDVPVVTISETPVPGDAAFQDWQTAQLERLAAALATATGR